MNQPECLMSILNNISDRIYLYFNTRKRYSECIQVQTDDACLNKWKVTSGV